LLTLAFRSAENRRGRARAARGWYARPQAGRRDCPQDPRKSASRFN